MPIGNSGSSLKFTERVSLFKVGVIFCVGAVRSRVNIVVEHVF